MRSAYRARPMSVLTTRRPLVVVAALAFAACAAGNASPATVSPTDSVTASLPAEATEWRAVNISNGTSATLVVNLNGVVIGTIDANTPGARLVDGLPDTPWNISVSTKAGVVLATLVVPSLAIVGSTFGYASRADLNCGRLDVWVGPPVAGGTFIPAASPLC